MSHRCSIQSGDLLQDDEHRRINYCSLAGRIFLESGAIMKGHQIAEHLCSVLAGGRTIRRPITLNASVQKHCNGSVSIRKTAVEGTLKAQSYPLVFRINDLINDFTRTQVDRDYVQRWSRIERETRQLK